MKRNFMIFVAASVLAFGVNGAEARKRTTSSVPTNYGCSTLAAGTTLTSADGLVQKRLLVSTSACYLCNATTRVCALQSPSALVGWTFVY